MIPTYQTLMLPVLKAFQQERSLRDVVEIIANELKLSELERLERLPSGKVTVLYSRVSWAKVYLTKAGLLEAKSRGVFCVTNAGRKVLAENVTAIDNEFLKQFPSFVEFFGRKNLESLHERNIDATPDEAIDSAYQEMYAQLKSDLLEKLKKTNPTFFERIVLELMRAMGYGVDKNCLEQITKRSHDCGIDGVINEDVLGLDKIYLQAKRYDGSVGREQVQAFVGALSGFSATKGVFITTGTFSSHARDYAKNQKIVMIDGERLSELLIEYNVGVSLDRKIEIKKIDLGFFEEEI
jgi:restriction system protein